jgi:hypothetical protein
LGGWLTRDPIGLAGGYLNLRSYLGNRPADALDVWGKVGNYLAMDGSNGVANSGDLSPLAKAVMDVWRDPRVAGTLQAVGGVAIICVAVGGSVGSGGTSLALLWVGADQTLTGLKQAYTEKPQQSYTEQAATGGAKALGASDETAAYIGRTTDTAGVLFASTVTIGSSYANASRMGNASMPKAVSTRVAAAETASTESAITTKEAQEAARELKAVEEAKAKCPPCPKAAKNVDLTDAKARKHILDGDANGGGHGAGRGKPGKSEFPADWSDDRVIHEISDVATDPEVPFSTPDKRGYSTGTKTVDGVDVKVVVDQTQGRIVTGYPTNVPRNP